METLCPPCATVNGFTTKFYLTIHKKIHNQETTTCPVCAKTFNGKVQLKRHEKSHISFSHKCPHCDKTYKWREILAKHIKANHRPDINVTIVRKHLKPEELC